MPENLAADPWKLNVTHVGDGLVVCTIGPACVALWRTQPVPTLFAVQRRELARVVERDPGKVAFICVVEPSADAPGQEVRDASSAMIAGHGKRLAACACVIEGSGFRAAIARTVLTGISLVARAPAPSRFFEHVTDASRWVSDLLAVGHPARLALQVEEARARLAVA